MLCLLHLNITKYYIQITEPNIPDVITVDIFNNILTLFFVYFE